MHRSVEENWKKFSEPLEGRTPLLYVDVKGLVTTGVGNLVDPMSEALKLPWKLRDMKTLASKDQVTSDWLRVKNSKLYLKASEAQTQVRLTDADIDALVEARRHSNEVYLRAHVFPEWDTFPADAQLAILSMTWAVGAGLDKKFPNFCKYANRQDWLAAKVAGHINTGVVGTPSWNPGVVPRNRHNELCFDNAMTVREYAMDATVLHWPNKCEPVVPGSDTPDTDPAPPPPNDSDKPAPALPLERDREAELEERTEAIKNKDFG